MELPVSQIGKGLTLKRALLLIIAVIDEESSESVTGLRHVRASDRICP